MKWAIKLTQPWYGFKVRTIVQMRFTASDIVIISDRDLYHDLILDNNPKGQSQKSNIWTIQTFFPEGTMELRFDDWSQAHAFKERMEGILGKLSGRLQKLAPAQELQPEPEPIAPRIAEGDWQAHALLMSGTGSGKTNAMRWRFLQILDDVGAGNASAVIMEPKGVLIAQILSLAQLYDMRDRVVIIDPEDTEHPVSVNIFERRQASDRNGALAMAQYLLDAMTMTLQPSHRQVLAAVNQLMFALPEEPWMGTLLDVLRNGASKYKAHFKKLTPVTQDFFTHEFDRERSQTQRRCHELLGRLSNLLGGETFDRLLYRKGSNFNLLDAIERGSLILINANERYLGVGEETKLFGKFWTAQLFRAGLARFDLLKRGKRIVPCWVFLDEVQTFVADDIMFGAMLDKLREAKVSVLAAMHYLQQIDSLRVRSAIDVNTSIKFSAIPNSDWHWQCDAPRFSGKVRFPFVNFESLPQMTPAQKREVLERSRSQFSVRPEPQPAPEPEPQHAQSTGDRGGLGPL